MDDFSQILYVKDLPELQALAVRLAEVCEADGAPIQAQRVRAAFLTALRELEELARTLSARATEILVEKERETRVRPDTAGDGGPRLEDYLIVEPLNALPGSIGVNNETLLDNNVRWWVTNEEGSSGRVGGVLFGHFFDAGWSNPSAPNPGEFREHPLFAPSRDGDAGRGIIRNPIPARRFVLRATEAIDPMWHEGVRAIRAKLEAEWSAALDIASAQAIA